MNEPRRVVLRCRSACLLVCMAGLALPVTPLAGHTQAPAGRVSGPFSAIIVSGWHRVPVRWEDAFHWRHAGHGMRASSFTSEHDLSSTARIFTQVLPALTELLVGRGSILLSGWQGGMHWVVQIHAGKEGAHGIASTMRAEPPSSFPQVRPLDAGFEGIPRSLAAMPSQQAGHAASPLPHWVASQGRLTLALASVRDGATLRQQVYVFPYPIAALRRLLAQTMAQDGWRPDALLAGMPALAVWHRQGAQIWLFSLQDPSSSALYLETVSGG